MFIARISRGRTIRQFVTGVLLVPSLVSLLWFAVFGGSATGLQEKATAAGTTTLLVTTVDGAPSVSFDGAPYNLVDALDMPAALTTVTIVLIMVLAGIFFVTGADSASIIMGSITSYGVDEPRTPLIVFWGVTLRRQLTDSVVNRSVRQAVDQHHGEVFDMLTRPSSGESEARSARCSSRAGQRPDGAGPGPG